MDAATKPPEDERLRRIAMIVRQGLYGIADEIGREFGLERPCKVCEAERRRPTRVEKPVKAA